VEYKNEDKKEEKKTTKGKKSAYEYEYKADYLSDLDVHDDYIAEFDALETMMMGEVFDSVSKSVDRSKITDAYNATLAIERASRVAAKLPEGNTESATASDMGKAAFMDILRQKWINPNANSQAPFLDKIYNLQLYSDVYGYMPMFIDWNVSVSGYIGPDCWLWNPRNLVPQQGRVSIEDMDYVHAISWVGHEYLEKLLEQEDGGWNKEALTELMERAEDMTNEIDTKRDTIAFQNRNTSTVKKGIKLVTRYEAGEDGKWCTFAPDHGCVTIREIKNPHKNGRIPFVIKYSHRLYDNFYGLGDMRRSQAIQAARDGLTNFYFHGIKMNLSPPIIANANGIVPNTIDASKPQQVMLETIPNSIRRLETNTAGLSTYQAAMSQLTGSQLTIYGSQNASIPGAEALNPSQGKTPSAIAMYSQKEASRDGRALQTLETALSQMYDIFYSLIANIGSETIPVSLFADDIDAIEKAGLTDITDLIIPNASETAGTLMINPEALKDVEYRFQVTSGTTMKLDKQRQLEALQGFMGTLGKFQNELKEDPTTKVNWKKLVTTYQNLVDIPGLEDVITEVSQEKQMMQQMQMQGGMPQEGQPAPELAPAAMNVRGMSFADPSFGAAAQEIDSLS
jgi:hypothetical protein